MIVYKDKTEPRRVYFPISRYIKIRETASGDYYFLFHGRRIHLSEIESLCLPIMVEDPKDGKLIVIGYCQTLCNFGGRLYELHPDCECIRVWDERQVEEEEHEQDHH